MGKRKDDDQARCVILHRDSPKHEWELSAITTRKSVAWISAEQTRDQEKRTGHKRFQCMVVLEDDYDNGRFLPLRPFRGFKYPFQHPGSPACVQAPAPEEVKEEVVVGKVKKTAIKAGNKKVEVIVPTLPKKLSTGIKPKITQ